MEIQSLKLVILDADLEALADEFFPEDAPAENVVVSIIAGAVQVSGDYPTRLLNVPFQTTWEPTIDKGKVRLHLSGIRVVGLPGGMLRKLFLEEFRRVAGSVPGTSVEDETLVLDVDRMLSARGIPLKTNLKLIRCEVGRMTIEA
jgi:hypothetical protein